MLICAQSGRVSGLEKKTDPASSSKSDKKGLKYNEQQSSVGYRKVPNELRISELSTLIRILNKPGGV